MTRKFFLYGVLLHGGLGVLMLNAGVQAEPAKGGEQPPPSAAGKKQDQPVVHEKTTVTTTTTTTKDEGWEIDGPVFLRSADPEPPGELILKNIFAWETNKHTEGDEDDNSEYFYEFEAEYGLVENHELIFALPFEVGDGNAEGNGDIELGWHWRLWEEDGNLPAFAIRNYLFLGTGHESDGVDYMLKGLITKTITPGSTRLHLNPWLKVVDADDDEDDDVLYPPWIMATLDDDEHEERDFQWGIALGMDHWLRENLLLIADYKYSSSEHEGYRDQHSAELGLDWHLDDCQTLGFATEVSLDGDSEGPCFAARISYMYSFGGK
jgi:hypothetical protein